MSSHYLDNDQEPPEQALTELWREMLAQAEGQPWLLRLLAERGTAIATRYVLWKQRLTRLRAGERRRLRQRLGVGMAGAALALALMAGPAQAAGITVDAGAAGSNSGDGCSLVEAIINANNNNQAGSTECIAGSGTDTITLPASASLSYTSAFGSSSALPDITSPIIIEGNGSTIQRTSGSFRIFFVTSATGNLTVNSATLSGGSVGGAGGAIHVANGASLAVTNSTLSGNTTSGSGGGIYNASGTSVSVDNSHIDNNHAVSGGGMFVRGPLTVTNSTISGNTATGSSAGGIYMGSSFSVSIGLSTISNNSTSGVGGGIQNSSTLTVANSTLSGNTAAGYGGGGGIYQTSNGRLTVTGSTLSNNSTNQGGGLLIAASTSITNSTISGNSTSSRGGGIANKYTTSTLSHSTLQGNITGSNGGGGLFASGNFTLVHSLIAGNTATDKGNEVRNQYATFNANAYNLFGHSGETTAAALSAFTPGVSDITATSDGSTPTALAGVLNPTLASNGGPTQTHALLVGSPAVDAADSATCAATDQRGITRPVDVNPTGPTGVLCDIGAFEIQSPTAIALSEFTAASGARGGLAGLAAGVLVALGLGGVFVRRRRNAGATGRSPVRPPQSPADSAPDFTESAYQPPAIIHRGQLELRAGSPLALPDFMDPDKPFP